MNIKRPYILLGLCAALTSCIPACVLTAETSPASSPIAANVYVQVAKGVNVYNVTASGTATLVHGSPFKITGQMEGITGSHLIAVGTTVLRSYQLASNGAVGAQLFSINTADYDSEDCGPTTGDRSVLDHSGKYFFVQLSNGPEGEGCGWNDWQAYQIGVNGDFTFLSNDYDNLGDNQGSSAFTIDSSDKYGYGFTGFIAGFYGFTPFALATNGALTYNSNFGEKDPAHDPTNKAYLEPIMAAADPHQHLAVIMQPTTYDGGAVSPTGGNVQLASYSIDTNTGSISSTNTQANAPFVQTNSPTAINMSFDGKFVAIGSTSGFQVFNFNGAGLPTVLSPMKLSGTHIDQISWDKLEHLYALSYKSQKLYVFNVKAQNGATQIGSAISVPGVYGVTGMIVVPK